MDFSDIKKKKKKKELPMDLVSRYSHVHYAHLLIHEYLPVPCARGLRSMITGRGRSGRRRRRRVRRSEEEEEKEGLQHGRV